MGLFILKSLLLTEHILGQKIYGKYFEKFHNKYLSAFNFSKNQTNKYLLGDQISKANKDIILYKGFANKWEAVKKWDLEYFENYFGEKIISLNTNPGLYDPRVVNQNEELTIREYIQQLKSGSRKYLKLSDLVDKEPLLKNQLELNVLSEFKPKMSTGETFYTFIGGNGTITPMHNEIPCNVFVQIFGKKKWVLYPPDDFPMLNTKAERRPYFYSEINPVNLDENLFPLARHASKIEIILEPGDVLYVPPFYWHFVENISDSISVAYKFANVPVAFRSSVFFTMMFMLATKPSIFTSFIIKRIKKKDYILDK